jgi:hypothetical protein
VSATQVLSAVVGDNGDLFPSILQVYVPLGAKVLDMTYGKGVFWRQVRREDYDLTTNDLVADADLSLDFRKMDDLETGAWDAIVLDPPYAYSPKGTMKKSIADCYRPNDSVDISTMAKVQELYLGGITEARRLLKPNGILIVKAQDIVQAGKQWWMHLWMMSHEGFLCEDLFLLVQKSIPTSDPKWKIQRHARKNHSFFVVLRKTKSTPKLELAASGQGV